ncbi:cob(I)yrinic acid a,c-diamide adenosyltransferase [Patescibacteria group bacterium]|nr:cob(I)yrinic acid a,c-diamide adenosyltransferase [Patescibacteria group bacterium]MBU0964131.1 cob(I)yrinic acid a,c-diamide adenosyltransferase [Patescibacteria group bacterium]
MDKGLVHVYTGDGKGKTTAALGLAVRAVSYKKKVLIIQFIKGPWRSGELDLVRKLKPYLQIKSLGQGFVKILGDKKPFAVHKKAAQQAFILAKKSIKSGKFDMVILDEINVSLKERLISTDEVVKLIGSKPEKVELVLTGRYAPAKIIKLADYVSEVKMVKHPFNRGILARSSIDY